MFERVYLVWEIYDGVRTGLADFKNKPHYFSCVFDEEYTDIFELSPVSNEFLNLANEQWKIYRAWEFLYHTGKEEIRNHPGHGNINKRYDEIEAELKIRITSLNKLSSLYRPEFRLLPKQDHLPKGVLKEIEVCWHEIT